MILPLPTGIAIAFDDVGEGQPVLFIHGFPHNRELWSPQVTALRDRVRCITPDLRGFGESDRNPPHSIDQYADDLAALLNALAIRRAVIVGLSMGGYIALAMWRRHRKLVRALVLADTRAGADSEEGKAKRNEMIALAQSSGVSAIADAQINGMLSKSTRESSPALVASVHAMLAAAPAGGVTGALQAMRDRVDSTPSLATIDVPTLILVGEEDVLTPPREAAALHGAIEGSVVEVIPRAGHLSNMESPETFNRALLQFLESLVVE
jgi:3-oxoadipate enol-lactonase